MNNIIIEYSEPHEQKPRNVCYSNIETEKHLTYISRSGKPHEMPIDLLASPTALASPSEKNPASPGRSNKEWSPAERRAFIENRIRENVDRLVSYPTELFHINVSVYKRKASAPERLTVNVDIIFDQGTKPFKLSADCVSRSRKREITGNTDQWGGYQYAQAMLTQWDNTCAYAGKLKNRRATKTLVPRRIVPKTVIIVRPDANNNLVAELVIDQTTYLIDLHTDTNPKSAKYFDLRGHYQQLEETEW